MIDKINHYSIENPASIYDEEAMTALELAGRTTAKTNEVVADQNALRQETEEHLETQDKQISDKFREQDARLDAQEQTQIPTTITSEVQKQINNGTFDSAIDRYAGELDARLNNLLSSIPEGGTSMDAELVDIRVGVDGAQHENAGVAVRSQFKDVHSSLATIHADHSNYMTEELINCLDMTDPDYLEGYGFSESTGNIVESELGVISGFIPIHKGELVSIYRGDGSPFLTQTTVNYGNKIILYDGEKNWLRTIKLYENPFDSDSVDFGVNGFVRVQFRVTLGVMVYKKGYGYIDKTKTNIDYAVVDALRNYVSYVDCVNTSDPNFLVGYGYSGATAEIVVAAPYNITGFIPITQGEWLSAYIGGYSVFTGDEAYTGKVNKMAIYDRYKNWVKTIILDDTRGYLYDSEQIKLGYDGFVRFHYDKNFTLNVYRSQNLTLDLGSAGHGVNTVDLIMFMGQSNMAGRGNGSEAPTLISGAGYEFRAITDPSKLYPITEPFGVNENNAEGIDDGSKKTGSMVTAFVNGYYSSNHIPVVGVSASEGGTSSTQWLPSGVLLPDAIQRYNDCVNYLLSNGYTIRHKYAVWCQGEGDADRGFTKETFMGNMDAIITELVGCGIEKMLLVRIGNCNEAERLDLYTNMIQWQTELAQTNENVVMVSTTLAGMRDRGLMKDNYHYNQAGYNECGTYAGVNAGIYASTGKEPTMYDPETGNLYYSHKN